MLFDRDGVLRRIDSLFATIPVIAYGIFYWVNIAVNGVGDGVYSNDWYGFLKAGYTLAPIIYIAFVLIAWGIALVFRLPRRSAQNAP